LFVIRSGAATLRSAARSIGLALIGSLFSLTPHFSPDGAGPGRKSAGGSVFALEPMAPVENYRQEKGDLIVSQNNKSEKKCLPESPVGMTFADYLQALFSSVTAEPLPAAIDKLLQRMEQRVRSQEVEA
jgi:hypothetical protein